MPKSEQSEREWISLVEAARMLQVGYQVAHRLLCQGALDSRRTDGHWMVSRRSVERLRVTVPLPTEE